MRQAVALPMLLTLAIASCGDGGANDDGRQSETPMQTEASHVRSSTSVVESSTTDERQGDQSAPMASTTTSTTSIVASSSSDAPTTTDVVETTPYAVPVRDVDSASWGQTHSGYPATDIFVTCGAEIVSPVNGTALEVRTIDSWNPDIDNPATRGGRSVTILGDDGVRYYLAHFDEMDPALHPGDRVTVGQAFGTMGTTGRSSACHTHFGISPPCPDKEWSVRRGVVAPAPYLDAWRVGDQDSPVVEVTQWAAANPDACAISALDPTAADS